MATMMPLGHHGRIMNERFTLTGARGLEADIIAYGGAVVSLRAPDRRGVLGDVVLGFDDLAGYRATKTYMGALVGRYANRIARGRFTLDGREHQLATNDGANHLHGGVRGFDKVVWDAAPVGDDALALRYRSRDGEEGYPGNLDVEVVYTVTAENELRIDYAATTDRDTVVNLSHHSYFNLGDGDILAHQLTIDADRYLPVDGGLIPTGEIASVAGTPFDFREATAIGARIDAAHEQLALAGGYDHNWVLRGTMGDLRRAARVSDPASGRAMEVWTTEPGLQFYSGNFLEGTERGKGGRPLAHRGAFCLETQHYPDSPNQPAFPTTRLAAGSRYASTTIYRFAIG